MKSLVKLEIRKAFQNKFFLISVITGCIITVFSFTDIVGNYLQSLFAVSESTSGIVYDPHIGINTVFNCWIGGEPFSMGSSVYFFIFPLLCALPYGWSYNEEKGTGYYRMVIVKQGKKSYYFAKYIAVFLAGGCAMIFPLIFNLWMVLLTVPIIKPEVNQSIYYAVFGGMCFSELYYTIPFLYVAIYLMIDFICCGFLSCICVSVSGIIRKKWVVVSVPFLLLLFIHIGVDYIYSSSTIRYKELSPFYFLRGVDIRYPLLGIVLLTFIVILFILSVAGIIKEYRNEIY